MVEVPQEIESAFFESLKYLTDTNTDVHRRCVAAIFYFYIVYPDETEDIFHTYRSQSNSRARALIRFFRERFFQMNEDVFEGQIKGIMPASTSYYTQFAYCAEYLKLIDEGEITMRNIRRWKLDSDTTPIFYPISREAVNVRRLSPIEGMAKIVRFIHEGHKTNNGINPNANRYILWVESKKTILYAEQETAKRRPLLKQPSRPLLTSEEFADHAALLTGQPKIARDHFRTLISKGHFELAQKRSKNRHLRPFTFYIRDQEGREYQVWESLQQELLDLVVARGYYPGADEAKTVAAPELENGHLGQGDYSDRDTD